MIEKGYLPVCSLCGKDLGPEEKPVALPCCHLYCQICVQGLKVCYLDEGTTAPIVDFTAQVQKLTRSYGTAAFPTELLALREAINVNLVNCPRGIDCRIRPKCPYSHSRAIPAESSSTGWKCVQCNLMVENTVCPFCRIEKPLQPQVPENVPVEDQKPSINPKPDLDYWLFRGIWKLTGILAGFGLIFIVHRCLRLRQRLAS